MGKSMYNVGKRAKEKARQQKQMDKAAKRLLAKQQRANAKAGTPQADSSIAEPALADGLAKTQPNGQTPDAPQGIS